MKEKPSILIVDDDHEVADTLAYIVKQRGHDIQIAYDGEWAVTLASRRNFDVAFIDILLPGMNGAECLSKFKKFCPAATVFMMTGFSSDHIAALCLQNGASDVLRKPVMPEDILARLEHSARDAVLVVDDDQHVSESFCAMLRKAGWKCDFAADGETALKMVSSKAYGAMILDLKLPNLSGPEVFWKLQGDGINIPTLVVTGHDGDYPRISHPLVCGYLLKPADPRVVLAMVEKVNGSAVDLAPASGP